MSIPRCPTKLPGSFWAITSCFNPVRYRTRRPNYRLFRESLKSQGIPLVAVELVHDDGPFELEESDAEILVQLRGGDILWQKERLLNVALEHLPADCDKVAWVDADVLFQSRHWVADTAELLEQYAFVQPFSFAFMLEPECTAVTNGDGLGLNYPARAASAYCWTHCQGWYAGWPGFAMAARREILQTHGLYDRLILGTADVLIAHAAMGIDPASRPVMHRLPVDLLADARAWANRVAAATQGSISYAAGNLFHLWHGTIADRRYHQQPFLLSSFRVHEDICIDSQGAWKWATNKPELHERVRNNFLTRREDGAEARRPPWWKRWPGLFLGEKRAS